MTHVSTFLDVLDKDKVVINGLFSYLREHFNESAGLISRIGEHLAGSIGLMQDLL